MSRVSHAEELDQPPWPTPRPVDLDGALLAARHGDEDAFRALYRHIQPRLLRYVRTLVGDEAEDVTSETWLHIARDIATFTGDIDGFRAWTATIARHRALDHLRHRKRRPADTTTAEELPDLPATENTETTALDSSVRLRWACTETDAAGPRKLGDLAATSSGGRRCQYRAAMTKR
jgi:RNA polymerase sigma factor (sigma-70 family)